MRRAGRRGADPQKNEKGRRQRAAFALGQGSFSYDVITDIGVKDTLFDKRLSRASNDRTGFGIFARSHSYDAPACLSRGPLHLPPRKHVHVQMIHGLAALHALIDDKPKSGRAAELGTDSRGLGDERPEQRRISVPRNRRHVLYRHD